MSARKGIILAGGVGTRLHPVTLAVGKQLLPVYDKPMIYYPLSVLMLAGIREVLVITVPHELMLFRRLLGNGSQWGMDLSFAEQSEPAGLPQALEIGETFLGDSPSCLILGDNLFYGTGLVSLLNAASRRASGATLFAYPVRDPSRYGVVEFGDSGQVVGLEEKPVRPRSRFAITGLYFFDKYGPQYAKGLTRSARGELEIVDLLSCYLERAMLHAERFGRGFAWLDAGTHESLMQASQFVQTVEQRQGYRIGCPEEIAFGQGWIDAAELRALAGKLGNSGYGDYLLALLPD